MAHAQKPDFVFRQNGRVHLNRRERQFSRLLAVEVCASAVVMLDKPCSQVAWRVLATHSVRQFPLHFPSRPSPCAITFQLESNNQDYCTVFWDRTSHSTTGTFNKHVPWFQASPAAWTRYALFLDLTLRRLVDNDVSGQNICLDSYVVPKRR